MQRLRALVEDLETEKTEVKKAENTLIVYLQTLVPPDKQEGVVGVVSKGVDADVLGKPSLRLCFSFYKEEKEIYQEELVGDEYKVCQGPSVLDDPLVGEPSDSIYINLEAQPEVGMNILFID